MGKCYAICCISVIMIAAMATMNQTNWHHPETEGGQAKEPKGTKIKIKWKSERESVLQTWSHVRPACTGVEYRLSYPTVFSPGKTWQCSVLFLSHWAEEQNEDRLISY